MKTFDYTNVNGDTVTVDTHNGQIVAIWLFGCNVLPRIKPMVINYVLRMVPGEMYE